MEILRDFKLTLGVEDVLRGEGLIPEIISEKKPGLMKAALQALKEGLTSIQPAALIQTVRVIDHRHERIFLEGGKDFSNSLVAHHLAGAEQVTFAVCTIGPELEALVTIKMKDESILGLALDGLGNAAVEAVTQQVCSRIGEEARASGLTASTPLSPGEPEWSVEQGHIDIFSHLDPSLLGITFTSGGMMIPRKSISFVMGVGREMSQTGPCERCSIRERCLHRHV